MYLFFVLLDLKVCIKIKHQGIKGLLFSSYSILPPVKEDVKIQINKSNIDCVLKRVCLGLENIFSGRSDCVVLKDIFQT